MHAHAGAVAVGFLAGLGLFALVYYGAARPAILRGIPDQVVSELRKLPPDASPLVEALHVEVIARTVGIAVQNSVAKELP